ncbi:MAG: glycerol-3-phosphate dehydrogenase/oxidase [Capsulimonadales bacterium]|nr:glycerol-3-phosphate dehydrogenase/oxidase [Capsulimonadales bacterium]
MNRQDAVARLRAETSPWDFVIIGGGATGLGAAVDAAARGYRVLLAEQHDFAKGTSSRSTKLVHGGVRYLKQGNISLVLEALHERGLLARNAPHLVHPMAFIVPAYSWWEGPFYGIGLKIYDRMAGKLGLHPSRLLSREETISHIPTIETQGLLGGVIYYDGQFDDARLAIDLAHTIFDRGGTAINHMAAVGLRKEQGLVSGVLLKDTLTGEEFSIGAKAVINATGVFCDAVRRMDDPTAKNIVAPSQGAHLVLPKSFLPGDSAIMVPHTSDGRVLFAVPWHDRVVVGTTDIGVESPVLEPRPMEEEIAFILTTSAKYLQQAPQRSDVLSVFAGLRPLVKSGDGKNSAALSRDHTILISDSGLITITGGKWTTYRKMAQDVVDQAETVAGFDRRPCVTEDLPIVAGPTDAPGTPLSPNLPYTDADIRNAVRDEMAQTVEDTLSRRTRALLLDARASREIAPAVARIMAAELGKDETWQRDTVAEFDRVAAGYLLP